MESLSSAPTLTWTIPSELSSDEYNELLNEVIQDYGKESDVCEGMDVNGAKEQSATRVAAAAASNAPCNDEGNHHSNWLAIWGPELLDVARYNEIDVVRAILQAAVTLDTNTLQQEPKDGPPNDTLLSDTLHYCHDATGNTALHMAAANGHTAILDLLLTVEYNQLLAPWLAATSVEQANATSKSSMVESPNFLFAQTNHVGNTALHWAAANGQADAVQLLLEWKAPSVPLPSNSENANEVETTTPPLWTVDVLQKNGQGRSILTEGFASNDARVMELLLSHDSASEERLISTTDNSNGTVRIVQDDDDDKTNNGNMNDDKGEKDGATNEKTDPSRSSVTHTFVFGPRPELHSQVTSHNDESINLAAPGTTAITTTIQIREWAMATSNEQSILGQDDPSHDTTGWSVWASSLICAQWMAHDVVPSIVNGKNTANVDNNTESSTLTTPRIVLELGAGCGVPGLTLARALMEHKEQQQQQRYKVFLTDFNPATVENLQYNIDVNAKGTDNEDSNVSVESVCMNWKDPSTWPQEAVGSKGGVDLLIGSDLIYQTDMVPLLMQTIAALRPRRFCYVAHTQRNGHAELLQALTESTLFEDDDAQRQRQRQAVPASYLANPLQSLDDDECFVHFNELVTASMSSLSDTKDGFFLYNFVRRT